MLPFRTVKSDVIGRVIRLGSVVHAILSRHAYPEPVSHALGEALALTGMLGSALKEQGQADPADQDRRAAGFPGRRLRAPGKVRGYANFDKGNAALADTRGRGDQGALLGSGHVAMTIDPGGGRDSYQGIVALANEPLVTRRTPISASPSRSRLSSAWRWRGTTALPRAAARALRTGAPAA